MMRKPIHHLAVALLLAAPAMLVAQQTPAVAQRETTRDMIDRIFKDREFTPAPVPPLRWLDGGRSYVAIEPVDGAAGASNVVEYDAGTGARKGVLIASAQLTPKGASAPLGVEDLAWSKDKTR